VVAYPFTLLPFEDHPSTSDRPEKQAPRKSRPGKQWE